MLFNKRMQHGRFVSVRVSGAGRGVGPSGVVSGPQRAPPRARGRLLSPVKVGVAPT